MAPKNISGHVYANHNPVTSYNGDSDGSSAPSPVASPVLSPHSIPVQVALLGSDQQRQEHPHPLESTGKRPRWMWWIGVVDIMLAFFFTGLLLNNIKNTDSDSDPHTILWQVCLGSLNVIGRLSLGFCLLIGFSIEKDGENISVCKFWIKLQLFCMIYTIFQIFQSFLYYAHHPLPDTETAPLDILANLIIFAYQVGSIIMVKIYSYRLLCKSVDSLVEENATGRVDETEQDEEGDVNHNEMEAEFGSQLHLLSQGGIITTAV